jgi:16S rRNA (adenine1518-N6/adenine1519-N6)-dimethyltransferase
MNHAPRKRFGQNFLHDANIIRKIIASMTPAATDHFVEIGPGRGAITQPLCALVNKLDVIEIDRDLAAALSTQPWAASLTVHCADALRFDFDTLTAQPGGLRLAGNLPYNISTPLLFHVLDYYRLFRDMHVMLQKEVVQRMTAEPGGKEYGRLTVALAARCQVEALFVIRPGSFQPAPQVDSAFARLTPLPEPLLDAVIAPVQGLLDRDRIVAAGIDPAARAENLTVADYVALSRSAIA